MFYGLQDWEDVKKKINGKRNKILKKISNNVGYIYIIKSNNLYKIGRTKNLKDRYKKYITENPNEIEMIYYFKTDNYEKVEEKLHKIFESKRHHGEWFNLDNDDIEKIKDLHSNK